MIKKSYKTQIYPNNKQETQLSKHIGAARWAFNWALNIKKKLFDSKEKLPSYMDLNKQLVKMKGGKDLSWGYDVCSRSLSEAVRDCDTAFSNFFRRCKQKIKGKKGFPRFKSKKNDKQSYRTYNVRVLEGHVKIPKVGLVRLSQRNYLPTDNRIISATISRRADRWFISVQVEESRPDLPKKDLYDIVGVDLGIKSLAVVSDGQTFPAVLPLKKHLRKLKKFHRSLSKKTKGGKNYEKARKKLANLYYRISNIRRDTLNKITSHLAKTKRVICLENLNVSKMLKNSYLSRLISDVGFYEFRRQLEYKCDWYECELDVADEFFLSSKTCSGCGAVNDELQLHERYWVCDCGAYHDRDYNASKNLENFAVGLTENKNDYGGSVPGLLNKSAEVVIK